jgi:hypothetical protein
MSKKPRRTLTEFHNAASSGENAYDKHEMGNHEQIPISFFTTENAFYIDCDKTVSINAVLQAAL